MLLFQNIAVYCVRVQYRSPGSIKGTKLGTVTGCLCVLSDTWSMCRYLQTLLRSSPLHASHLHTDSPTVTLSLGGSLDHSLRVTGGENPLAVTEEANR